MYQKMFFKTILPNAWSDILYSLKPAPPSGQPDAFLQTEDVHGCLRHTPLGHDRQQGCTSQTVKAGSLKNRITHSFRNGDQPADSVKKYTYPYLLSLHLNAFSMLAFSPISHCNSSWQLVKVFWDAARRDTTPSSG